MQISELLGGGALSAPAAQAFSALIEAKLTTPEIGLGPRIPALDAWIEPRLDAVPATSTGAPDRGEAARDAADRVFRSLIAAADRH